MAGLVRVQRLTATTDSLTGLRTRGHFNEVLLTECDRARGGQLIGLVIADADRFKHINDTHGHPAGDEVLAEIGRRLREVVRPTDTIARYGGEEFAVLVPGASPDDVRALGERIRAVIADTPITVDASTDSTALAVTVSVGVASAGGVATDPQHLVRTADRALYDAKRDGRNRVHVGDTVDTVDSIDSIGEVEAVVTTFGPEAARASRV
jgi:diguanylate cyclase (GGDEF)-like protein